MGSQGEWGPWIEHDGKGCPVRGKWVRVEWIDGVQQEGIAGSYSGLGWDASAMPLMYIVRYRVRRPRALIEMIERAENMPATKPQEVDA